MQWRDFDLVNFHAACCPHQPQLDDALAGPARNRSSAAHPLPVDRAGPRADDRPHRTISGTIEESHRDTGLLAGKLTRSEFPQPQVEADRQLTDLSAVNRKALKDVGGPSRFPILKQQVAAALG